MASSTDERSPLLRRFSRETGHTGASRTHDGPWYTVNNVLDDHSTTESQVLTSETSIEPPDEEKILNARYQSLDYDPCENVLYQNEANASTTGNVIKIQFQRWVVMFFIGVFTALVAFGIDVGIETLSSLKYSVVKYYIDRCINSHCLSVPFVIWVFFNICFVTIASILVAYGEPVAAGSGIPQIKCYLNGVKIPNVVRLKTLVVKALGVLFSVSGGLAVGKEGPMIHSGAVIAAGISQGRSTSLKKDLRFFNHFRSDTEKRDFVSGGAAAGVSAAFGAPVGGVLFSLEEGASFWKQSLTWRIFFSSMISSFVLNVVLSYWRSNAGGLSYPGLITFGKFDNLVYSISELPLFVIIGAIGGLTGALFNYINQQLSIFRMKHVFRKFAQVFESIIVVTVTTTIGFVLMYFVKDCHPLNSDPGVNNQEHPVQLFCDDGEYNAMASLFFQTPEESVKVLLHSQDGTYQPVTLVVFSICYFLLACWTYGLYVPSGLFIPSLLTGAAWGRLIGVLVGVIFKGTSVSQDWLNPGKFALLGAAAQLGGTVRMTISLAVILIEATGDVSFGLPIMVVLMTAKWVGDFFNEGIYDMHIQLAGVPLLAWEAPAISKNIYAKEVMSHPVTTFRMVENVGHLYDTLMKELDHDGFPIVDDYDPDQSNGRHFGRFKGLILRSQLLVLLHKKAFKRGDQPARQLRLKDFRDIYPRFPSIHQISISSHERQFDVDFEPYMNPAPFTVTMNASLPRIFRLFRGLGLRHVVVTNDDHQVVGLVTRKDLARYRVWSSRGRMGLEELQLAH